MQQVEVRQVIAAPVEAVWNRYTDHRSWTEWAGIGTVTLAREGTPAPNGVGCVRVISNAGLSIAEEVLSFDAPTRMTYRIVRGALPISDHLGEVVFAPHPDGTLITWRCRFNSRIPGLGGLFRLGIARLFRNALRGLERRGLAGTARRV
jgi:uncharacterized protein YndB with AHSA1/START domain